MVAPEDRRAPRLCGQTVRERLCDFLARDRRPVSPPHRTGPDAARRDGVAEALRASLEENLTWTSRQLAEAHAGPGITLGARQIRRYMRRMKVGYCRTASSLKHNAVKAERAGKVPAILKAHAAGAVKLYYLDERGFAPHGVDELHLNAPGASEVYRRRAAGSTPRPPRPFDCLPRLEVFTAERTWDSHDLLGFLKALPWSKGHA